jgi:hypothetical protein
MAASWAICWDQLGFGLGFGLGWLPSIVVARLIAPTWSPLVQALGWGLLLVSGYIFMATVAAVLVGERSPVLGTIVAAGLGFLASLVLLLVPRGGIRRGTRVSGTAGAMRG